MKGTITLIFTVLMAGGIVACSDDKAATGGSGGEKSTALSIDTGEGSFSYQNDAGGESTSVSVDAKDDGEGKGK